MSSWKMLVVDDHPLVLKGLQQLFSFESEFDIVAEATTGTDALAFARQYEPDLILLDLNMKGMSGLDTLTALRQDEIYSKVIILTVSDSKSDVKALIEAGADGYILKDTHPDEMIRLLKGAMVGEVAYSEEVKSALLKGVDDDPFSHLTPRELEILSQVALGLSNKQIGDRLFISESTVKVHLKSLLKKLKVKSRVAATVLYLENQ